MSISWKTCFKICLSVFILFICMEYFDKGISLLGLIINAATPLFLGCAIAYILNIIMSFYEMHYFPKSQSSKISKSRRPVCMLLSIISLLVVATLIVNLVVPQLSSCTRLLFSRLPGALETFVEWLSDINILSDNIAERFYAIDWQSKIMQIINVLISGIGNVADVVMSAVSGIITFFLSLIFAIYVLLGKDKLGMQFNKLMNSFVKENVRRKIMHVISVVNDCFHSYIVGQCTEAVILGVLCMLGMLILRLPYAAMTGALIGFTALIPVAGAYIGAGIGAFMILTVSPVKALVFLVFIVILQQLEGNLIYPKVVGSSIGLPAIWVLTAVTVGGGLMGIMGMLIGVPITAALYRLIREKVNDNEISRT